MLPIISFMRIDFGVGNLLHKRWRLLLILSSLFVKASNYKWKDFWKWLVYVIMKDSSQVFGHVMVLG